MNEPLDYSDAYPEPPFALVECDKPFLSLGPDERSDVRWSELQKIVELKHPLVWSMLGEDRVIPLALLQDTWRLIQDYIKMVQIERGTGIHVAPYGFTRQQTEPWPPEEADKHDHDHVLDPVNPVRYPGGTQ